MPGAQHLPSFDITLERRRSTPLADQISASLRAAIFEGRLEPGDRLPSWLGLAAQLGVARGTVKAAYAKLADEMLVTPAGAAGTRVAAKLTVEPAPTAINVRPPLESLLHSFDGKPLPFQVGAPAHDAFPAKQWSRIRSRLIREESLYVGSSDPRGASELRARIASYLAVVRGISCAPDQIIITSSFQSGLSLTIRALALQGQASWVEDPGCPLTRKALELDGLTVVPIPVDDEGLDVGLAVKAAPYASLAVVTASQQAPTGVALSQARRAALLRWAKTNESWIVEDDHLAELCLFGPAPKALAAEPGADRVIHIGSFNSTFSPTLGVGYVVAPPNLAEHFGEAAACAQPAPNLVNQRALESLLAEGHYFRHVRSMTRLYQERLDRLLRELADLPLPIKAAGLTAIMQFPDEADDVSIARQARPLGIAPMPLSVWSTPSRRMSGLLLAVSNLREGTIGPACASLRSLLSRTIAQ